MELSSWWMEKSIVPNGMSNNKKETKREENKNLRGKIWLNTLILMIEGTSIFFRNGSGSEKICSGIKIFLSFDFMRPPFS